MYQNTIISVFLDIAKFADFLLKNADVSRTQVVCHVIHISFWIFFRKGITVPSFIILGCLTDFREGRGFLPTPPTPTSVNSLEKAHPE